MARARKKPLASKSASQGRPQPGRTDGDVRAEIKKVNLKAWLGIAIGAIAALSPLFQSLSSGERSKNLAEAIGRLGQEQRDVLDRLSGLQSDTDEARRLKRRVDSLEEKILELMEMLRNIEQTIETPLVTAPESAADSSPSGYGVEQRPESAEPQQAPLSPPGLISPPTAVHFHTPVSAGIKTVSALVFFDDGTRGAVQDSADASVVLLEEDPGVALCQLLDERIHNLIANTHLANHISSTTADNVLTLTLAPGATLHEVDTDGGAFTAAQSADNTGVAISCSAPELPSRNEFRLSVSLAESGADPIHIYSSLYLIPFESWTVEALCAGFESELWIEMERMNAAWDPLPDIDKPHNTLFTSTCRDNALSIRPLWAKAIQLTTDAGWVE